MTPSHMIDRLCACALIPVIKIEDASRAEALAEALLAGGLRSAEITFRTAAAQEAIKRMSASSPNLLVGAGTVLTVGRVKEARDAGAQFIVTPGFNPEVVRYCVENGIPIIPGVSSPSQIEQALAFGLKTVKFFPAETSGGLKAIKAMSAPYVDATFVPTGGINVQNVGEYLAFDKVIACGGSWMVESSLINEEKFGEITRLSSQAISAAIDFKLHHLGMNTPNDDEARSAVALFQTFFGFGLSERATSYFVSPEFEVMKLEGRGTKGHIAIGVNSVEAAIAFLENRGVEIDRETIKKSGERLSFAYLKPEIAGFALHLIKR